MGSNQYGSPVASPDEVKNDIEKLLIDSVPPVDCARILEELKGIEGVAAHPTKPPNTAMGDAPEEVKSIADFVTETLRNDGVAVAIDKLI